MRSDARLRLVQLDQVFHLPALAVHVLVRCCADVNQNDWCGQAFFLAFTHLARRDWLIQAPKAAKPGGKPPKQVRGPDQINLTDEDSRIMPVAGGGFDQCYNAQLVEPTGDGS
jgi:hypothetical protein